MLLPAYAEIMLAVDDIEEARSACRELGEIAAGSGSAMLDAIAARVRGAVELAEGDAAAALASVRHAWQVWQELEAPYEVARARVLVGLACARSVTKTPPRSSWVRPVPSSSNWARRRTSPASTRTFRARPRHAWAQPA